MKFKYGLVIKTENQDQADTIISVLVEIGYRDLTTRKWFSNYPYLVTDFGDEGIEYGTKEHVSAKKSRILIQEYNLDLIRALASMRDDNKFYKGEIVVMKNAGDYGYAIKNNGCLAQITAIAYPYYGIPAIDGIVLNPNTVLYANFSQIPVNNKDKIIIRKATSEEIINFYNSKPNMKKEIIGYKLIKRIPGVPKDTEFTFDGEDWQTENKDWFFSEEDVKDTEFFEPIYKAEETIIRMNDQFSLTIKNGRVFHKNEDITTFVKDMGQWFNNLPSFGNYTANLSEVIFSRTGCQENTTSSKQWMEVYNLIK